MNVHLLDLLLVIYFKMTNLMIPVMISVESYCNVAGRYEIKIHFNLMETYISTYCYVGKFF